jgi:hypothetical protein
MKAAVLIFALAATTALAQDTASTKTRSSALPFRGVHFDWGAARLPYLDRDGQHASAAGLDLRLSLPLRRAPDWSVAFATNILSNDTTAYVVPASVASGQPGFHPRLTSWSTSLEVQRRWNQRRKLHAIASAGAGTIANSYDYYATTNGTREFHEDEKTRATFATIAGGAELDIARFFRASLMAGYRSGGRMTIPQASGSNGGLTATFNLELGVF